MHVQPRVSWFILFLFWFVCPCFVVKKRLLYKMKKICLLMLENNLIKEVKFHWDLNWFCSFSLNINFKLYSWRWYFREISFFMENNWRDWSKTENNASSKLKSTLIILCMSIIHFILFINNVSTLSISNS